MPNHGGHVVTNYDDRTLLVQASSGDDLAFEELYRRHADAAWRAANAIVSNADDAADAVAEAFTRLLRMVREGEPQIDHLRAYLLTVTRHAAIDRRRSREDAWDFNGETFSDPPELVNSSASPSEAVIDLTDETYVVRAFRELPDRWRQVLWLTEVQGLRPVDAAEQLGMSANAVAQLAFRARAGLRERYMQAHVSEADDGPCAGVRERLGALALEKLADGERERIDTHLETCGECRERVDDLRAFAPQRGRNFGIAPLVFLGDAARRFAGTFGTSDLSLGARIGQAAAGKAAAAMATAAMIGAGVVGPPGSTSGSLTGPPATSESSLPSTDGVVTTITSVPAADVKSGDVVAAHASVTEGPDPASPASLTPVASAGSEVLSIGDGVQPEALPPAAPGPPAPPGQGPPGNGPDGNGPPGNGPDGQGPPGNGPDGKGAPGNGPDGQGPPGNGPDGNGAPGNGPDGQGPPGNGPDRNGPDGQNEKGDHTPSEQAPEGPPHGGGQGPDGNGLPGPKVQ